MKRLSVLGCVLALAACGPTQDEASSLPAPERTSATSTGGGGQTVSAHSTEEGSSPTGDAEDAPIYWGVEPGEPLPILWEELITEASEEELIRQQAEFYATLEQRYAANMTTLADIDSFEAIEEGSELDFMPQLGTFDVVEELNGQLIRIPGYIVPFDFGAQQRYGEFLFVPYMGACIHTPPPPPNQIIYVQADPQVRVDDIWRPYWLEGELRTEKNLNDVGNAAYTLALTNLELYPTP
ncbi:MAG: DUF3299 domain-containing protein [Pseudomonadota bacterium]